MDNQGNEWNDEAETVLRATDEAAIEALRAGLDVEGRLAEVLAKVEFDTNARDVLALWTMELAPAMVRSAGTPSRIVRSVASAEFFAAATGRQRVGLDPWPDVALLVDQKLAELRIVLSLPERPPAGVGLVAVAHRGTWTAECALVPSHTREHWPVDLTCRVDLPVIDLDEAGELAVDLLVVRAGD